MPRAIIIDPHEVLTDEAAIEREAIGTIRQLVAQAGVRVPETAVTQAEQAGVQTFAPNFLDAVIFRLVNRDFSLALKVSGQFRRIPVQAPKLRPEAAAILDVCHQAGWKIALTSTPHEDIVKALQKNGTWDKVNVKGPPPAMKIDLPDPRVLEFLIGNLAVTPRDCLLLGTRLDNNIRPAKTMRMTAIHLKLGRHGHEQLPRDMRDVPDYEAADIKALLTLLPTIQ
ncbi:MAG: hypothetical protein IPP14_15995 [Planctomycetes bacterium]|nr:hypothetical protein [Planctomycetota bacterium]